MAIQERTAEPSQMADNFHATGPKTLAGSYLRHHWQPIYHIADLPRARPVPIRIMSQDFVLYRGEGGATHLLDARCPHRGMQLSSGWIEGDCVRCFYHGWMYDPTGQCVDQPAEDSEFAHKVKIGSYPTEEYLGLVFAWLGEGEPPPLPRFADFERFEGVVEIDSYRRDCNYFQNVENALDMSHVAFVHGDNRAAFREIGRGHDLHAEESNWGISYTFTRADGKHRTQQFGMPNTYNLTALPTDPDIGWQESLFWWVPVDDERHIQFSIHRVPVTGAVAEEKVRCRVVRGFMSTLQAVDPFPFEPELHHEGSQYGVFSFGCRILVEDLLQEFGVSRVFRSRRVVGPGFVAPLGRAGFSTKNFCQRLVQDQ